MKKKSLLLILLMVLLAPWAANAQETLTVYDGTDGNSNIPFYGLYADTQGAASECVFPSDMLSEMAGGTITEITFYIKSAAAVAWTGTHQVYVGEVSETTLTGITGPTAFTVVKTASFDATGTELTIAFDAPYTYDGGNLLIGTYVSVAGNWKSATFAGKNQEEYTGWYRNSASASGSGVKFLPKTTFTYEAPSTGCDMPTSLVADPVEAHEATLTWDGSSDTYAIEIKGGSYTDWYLVEDGYMGKTLTISGLSANTPYQARVQSICTSGESNWRTTSFTTPIACQAPTGLAVTLTPGDGTVAEFSWTENGTATSWQLCLDGDETDLIDMDSNPFTYDKFVPEQTYTAKVRAYCDAIDQSTWSNTITFTPTDAYSITVNDGTKTNGYIPVYGYYVDGSIVSQFIMPAADLAVMQYGTIDQLTFYASQASVGWADAIFEVYMTEVDYTTFSSTTLVDWTTMDKVMNAAHLEISDNKLVVTLDAPYQYMGDNLMIGFKQTTSGTYGSSTWYGIEATGASLGGNNSGSQQNFLPKTTFAYTPGSAPACAKPTGLAVNYTGGTEATVSWTSEATAWNIDVNGNVTAITENPYTLTGLELAKTYEVKVQADCGGAQSEWTNAVSFTTDACMPQDMIVVNYELADSYGDGWNGNAILVVDENCNIVEQLTIANGSSATGTVKVCGSLAQFMWYKGNYPGETSWTFTNTDGDLLFEGTGSTDMATYDVLYTIDLNPYSMPADIEVVEVGPYSAKLGWTETGTATAWQIGFFDNGGNLVNTIDADTNPYTITGLTPETEYNVNVRATGTNGTSLWPCVGYSSFTTLEACSAPTALNIITPDPFSANIDWTDFEGAYDIEWSKLSGAKDGGRWMQYDNGTVGTNIGGNTASEQTWGVMYPPTMTQGYTTLSKVAFYVNTTYHTNDITVNIYQGEDPITGSLLATQIVTPATTTGMMEVDLDTPLTIDPTKNLWITLTTTGTYVKTGSPVTEPNDRWVLSSGAWVDVATLNDALAGYGWMIRGYVEDFDATIFNWSSDTGIVPPYAINNLNPETTYMVKVKASCGTDWKWAQFTTPSACDAPFDLDAEPLDESATLSWTGYQDKYNVKYRTLASYNPIWEDNFENGLNQWTIIAGENAQTIGTNAAWYTINPISGLEFPAYSGDYCASSWSWNSSAYYANNWLITPQLEFQGVVKYYVRTNQSYPDSYEVLLSTTTTDTLSFNKTLKAMAAAPATGDWEEVIIDLKDFAGQTGYIAFHHLDYDANYLLIDDFGMYTVTPASDWTTLNNQDNPATITTLPGKPYEYQVQGINVKCTGGVTDWSESGYFTTYDKVYDNTTWDEGETTIDDDVLLIQDVIIPDGVVVYANSITLEAGAQLIIEDGGQLYTNESVEATVLKSMEHATKASDNWYTIASPVDNVTTSSVNNLINSTMSGFEYDMYMYDEPSGMWFNQKETTHGALFTHLTNGRGYLCWNNKGAELEFTGDLNVDDVTIALTASATGNYKGVNLIGNPFSHNIYKGVGGAIDSDKLAQGFYILDKSGATSAQLDYTTPIKPCQGLIVQATEAFNLTIANSTTPATSDKKRNDNYIMFSVSNNESEDVTYALFNDGIGLEKMSHRNANIPMIYIPQNDMSYAIATMSDDVETFDLSFVAKTTGVYTLTVKANSNYSYLHIYDKYADKDVDMLKEGKYSFIGSPQDNAERFIVRFGQSSYSDFFVYQSGDEIVVNGDGELQVFDVMGRFVNSYNVNGNMRISASQFSNAVYIFRMVGNDVKTQKIVVK